MIYIGDHVPARRIVVGADDAPAVKKPWGPYANEEAATQGLWLVVHDVVPSWTFEGQLTALAIWYAESRFGVTPDWQFPDGTPSYNLGAIMRTGGKQLEHRDTKADGTPVKWSFAAFDNSTDAATYWTSQFATRLNGAVAAANAGNARAVAEAMYASCWFSGTCPPTCTDDARIEAYAKVIVGAAQHVATTLGTTSPIVLGERKGIPLGKCAFHDANGGASPSPSSGGGSAVAEDSGGSGAAIIGIGAGAIWLLKKLRG